MTEVVWDVVAGYRDRATLSSEAAVQRVCRRILNHFAIWHFVPPANAYGQTGISDVLCLHQGRFVALELKFRYNKPTANQLQFGAEVEKSGGLFLVANERDLVEKMVRLIAYVQHGEDPDEGI